MSSARNCRNCNAIVPDGHHYCGRCGASHNENGLGAENETLFFGAMQAPGRAKLILIKGEGLEGLSYHLNATEHVAGRSVGAILFPEDEYLSAKHASFIYRDNKLYLRDEASANGTFVRIRSSHVLKDGDHFMVGEQLFRLQRLDLEREYPMREQTLMYISPPRDYKFRIVHVLAGGKPGAAYCSPNNDLVIGREGADVLFADDRHISRQHARVSFENDQVVLSDMDSKNGTFLRLQNEHPMEHGDYVCFGSELMRVEINA
ncbi:MAG: FHA domain-containing protein [Bradymonadaceae bacterium]|nr:FHA domain-containing protein [Lujinxingiaceae bacterium]